MHNNQYIKVENRSLELHFTAFYTKPRAVSRFHGSSHEAPSLLLAPAGLAFRSRAGKLFSGSPSLRHLPRIDGLAMKFTDATAEHPIPGGILEPMTELEEPGL